VIDEFAATPATAMSGVTRAATNTPAIPLIPRRPRIVATTLRFGAVEELLGMATRVIGNV
jgi:hypothetical protein